VGAYAAGVAVTFAEIVRVLVPTAVMYVRAGMPVPVIGIPVTSPETFVTARMEVVPLLTMPVGVALAELVIAVITAPEGIPVPDIACPARTVAGIAPIA